MLIFQVWHSLTHPQNPDVPFCLPRAQQMTETGNTCRRFSPSQDANSGSQTPCSMPFSCLLSRISTPKFSSYHSCRTSTCEILSSFYSQMNVSKWNSTKAIKAAWTEPHPYLVHLNTGTMLQLVSEDAELPTHVWWCHAALWRGQKDLQSTWQSRDKGTEILGKCYALLRKDYPGLRKSYLDI